MKGNKKQRGQVRAKVGYYHDIYAVELIDGEPPKFILAGGDALVLRFKGDSSGYLIGAYWEIIEKEK